MICLTRGLIQDQVFGPEDTEKVAGLVLSKCSIDKTSKKCWYYNIPTAFDIESTSTYLTGKKFSFMYVWTFSICGYVIMGRRWVDFVAMLAVLNELMRLSNELRLVIYVHNLSFEFSFMQKILDWSDVFAVKSRTPIYAVSGGFEFRCSYLLTGYKLEKLAEKLEYFKISKLVGELDYTLIRHSETPLTQEELQYCINDVLILICYIAEQIYKEGRISGIPLTKTGYVRRYCRKMCMGEKGDKRGYSYRSLMKALTLDSELYIRLSGNNRPGKPQKPGAFSGGYTHSNPLNTRRTLENVTSYDITSSYPTVMVCEEFPMSSGELYEPKDGQDFIETLKNYCCLFTLELWGVDNIEKFPHASYISKSKCTTCEQWEDPDTGEKFQVVEDNGRIAAAGHVILTITEQDYFIIRKVYNARKQKIHKLVRFRKALLPRDLVLSILKLYEDKTALRNVKGRESDYSNAKAWCNSTFGMIVTDIVREIFPFIEHWLSNEEKEDLEPDLDEEIAKYNNSRSRFLFYPWGVWVCSLSRRNLWMLISECGEDFVYSDTDSVKFLNAEKHISFIEKYNEQIKARIKRALIKQGIDPAMASPKTIKGEEKPLGVWDLDGKYTRFKTLGAKRYMYEMEEKKFDPDHFITRNVDGYRSHSLTVSGVKKEFAIPYLLEQYGSNGIFEHFDSGLKIPADRTGCLCRTYIDKPMAGMVTDYLGNELFVESLTGQHLEAEPFDMSITSEYVSFIEGLMEMDLD